MFQRQTLPDASGAPSARLLVQVRQSVLLALQASLHFLLAVEDAPPARLALSWCSDWAKGHASHVHKALFAGSVVLSPTAPSVPPVQLAEQHQETTG